MHSCNRGAANCPALYSVQRAPPSTRVLSTCCLSFRWALASAHCSAWCITAAVTAMTGGVRWMCRPGAARVICHSTCLTLTGLKALRHLSLTQPSTFRTGWLRCPPPPQGARAFSKLVKLLPKARPCLFVPHKNIMRLSFCGNTGTGVCERQQASNRCSADVTQCC
jgi:hypothetical protein